MKKIAITTTLAMLTLATAAAFAAPRGGGFGGGPDGSGGFGPLGVFMQLDLEEDQREAIRGIFEEFRPRLEASRTTMGELRDEMRSAVKESGFNEALIRPIADSIGAAAADAAVLRAEMGARLHDVLTDEQVELLEELGPGQRGRSRRR